MRVVLSQLSSGKDCAIDINDIPLLSEIASNREWFDQYSGVSSSDLTQSQIDTIRPSVYHAVARHSDGDLFVKIHDACIETPSGDSSIPAEITKGVLYLVRNPLDIVPSFSAHLNQSIESTVEMLCNPDLALSSTNARLHRQLRQRILDWSSHVTSWIDRPEFRCEVIRFEDMVNNPLDTFRRAAQFLGLPDQSDRIERALNLCSFENLRAQERTRGFAERARNHKRFFRKGVIGEGHITLTTDQIFHIIEVHGATMRRLGYPTDIPDL